MDVSSESETRQQVEQWLDGLEEWDRSMLVLKEVQGFTAEEIVEMIGINGNTVKVRVVPGAGKDCGEGSRRKTRSKRVREKQGKKR